jgi:hypothetical protein
LELEVPNPAVRSTTQGNEDTGDGQHGIETSTTVVCVKVVTLRRPQRSSGALLARVIG